MHKLAARSLATAFLAGLLSLVMVTPAVAEGEWTPDPDKLNAETKYKYGYDYYKKEMGTGQTYTYKMGDKIPVSPTVNPSAPKPLWPSNVPLTGKIIEPAKTPVRIPSTYGPVTAYAGGVGTALGWSRLIGGVGLGIGGTSLAPANAAQVAINQGVSAACANNTGTCTADEQKKKLLIGSCGNLTGANSCATIGAVGVAGETDLQKWFSNEALPFLEDLWAQITGQSSSDVPSDAHYEVVKDFGCQRHFGVEKITNQSVKIHSIGTTIEGARPATAPRSTYWDARCSPATLAKVQSPTGTMQTVCIDGAGSTFNSSGAAYGLDRAMNSTYIDEVTGLIKFTACPTSTALLKVRLYNHVPFTSYSIDNSNYGSMSYTEWVNPDPALDTIEDTKITTNWDCRTADGSFTQSYSKTLAKISSAVAPECPAGTELTKHDIKVSEPGSATGTKTLDAGAAKPGEMVKYPDCVSGPCALQVRVDGLPCTTSVTDCRSWPVVNASTPSRVQCYWGNYLVPTSDCTAIANGYQSDSGVVFDQRSGTWVAIDTYGNPIAPNAQPWNPANPNPVAGTSPTTGTTPGTGTSTPGFPGSGTSPSDNCVSPSWSWNPVDWVKSPVICALDAAFVPKTDISARLTTLQGLTTTHPPFSWFTPVFTGPSGGGCPNWNIVLPTGTSVNAVCDSSFTAAILGVRGPMFGILAAAMVWPLMRSLWYAAIPILRVTPSGGR